MAADVRWHLPAGDSQANGEGEAALPPRARPSAASPAGGQLWGPAAPIRAGGTEQRKLDSDAKSAPALVTGMRNCSSIS